jgi:hypothetical protein
MPRKLSPEEATVMIIRRRLQQMEEDKMARRDAERDEDESSEQSSVGKRTGSDTAEG